MQGQILAPQVHKQQQLFQWDVAPTKERPVSNALLAVALRTLPYVLVDTRVGNFTTWYLTLAALTQVSNKVVYDSIFMQTSQSCTT